MDAATTANTSVAPHPARYFFVAWVFLSIAVSIGLLLRVHAFEPIVGINYAYLVHAHSHVAFLGWVFNAFVAIALHLFVPSEQWRGFHRWFILCQAATVGMLLSYPFQGYGLWSILASTLHMLCSAVIGVRLWRFTHACGVSGAYLRAGLVFMFISGVGPLALGPLSAMGHRDSPWYTLAIYFYLHCQYNGWFVFLLQGAFLRQRQAQGAILDVRPLMRAQALFVVGVVLTFALSALWMHPPAWVKGAAFSGVLCLVYGCGLFFREIFSNSPMPPRPVHPVAGFLFRIGWGAFGVKVALQLLALFPFFEAMAVGRHAIIGFLHLVFLGMVTPLLLSLAVRAGWVKASAGMATAVALYLAGAVGTEVVLGAVAAGWMVGGALPLIVSGALACAGVLFLLPYLRESPHGVGDS